jgi:hypothetical protein
VSNVIPLFGQDRDPIARIVRNADERDARLASTVIFSGPLRQAAAECRAAAKRLSVPTPIFDERTMTIRGVLVDIERLREEICRERVIESTSLRESLRLRDELAALDGLLLLPDVASAYAPIDDLRIVEEVLVAPSRRIALG